MENGRTDLYYRLMKSGPLEMIRQIQINTVPQFFYCEPNWNWRPRPLPDYDIWFVAEGRGVLDLASTEYKLSTGTCFVVRPGEAPRGDQDPNHRLVVFACHFLPLDDAGQTIDLSLLPRPLVVHDTGFFVASAHRVERLWRRGDDEGKRLARVQLGGLLELLWDEAAYPPGREDAPLAALAADIRREPARHWTLDGMAAQCHLSRAQFTRRFRAAYNTSPAHFVIQVRLERARQLLAETDLTLEQIAGDLGYGDMYFFSRQFKQFVGRTPGEVRKRARQ